MKNYKLLNFNKKILSELGFVESLTGTILRKSYKYREYDFIDLCIVKGKEYIYFYKNRFFLPCELKSEIGDMGVKFLNKEIKEDLKKLKELVIIK